MSCILGLWVGESFAEAVLMPSQLSSEHDSTTSSTPKANEATQTINTQHTSQQPNAAGNREKDSRYSGASNTTAFNLSSLDGTRSRWFLAKKSLADGLREILKSTNLPLTKGEVHLATKRAEQSLNRQRGRTPALVVTAGFESLLSSQGLPSAVKCVRAPFLAPPTQSSNHLSPQDHIFGVQERTLSSGQVELAPKIEDLEFLAAKFELLEVRDVAIGFLNSHRNPENENQVANFFRERGFRCVCSHTVSSSLHEATRWQRAIECAYSAEIVIEEKQAIQEVLQAELGDNFANWQIKIWDERGLNAYSEDPSHSPKNGVETALQAHFAKTTENTVLHLGLERFYLLTQKNNGSERTSVATPLSLQPTQLISMSSWLVPSVTEEERGYEPGPMAFGRSHHLSALDIFFMRDHLDSIETFSALITEKSKSRIQEALFMLGKSIPNTKGPSDPSEIAVVLEQTCIERIANALALQQVTGKVRLSGAFATSFLALLRKRRPDLSFVLDPDAEWSLAMAAGGQL